MDKVVESKHLFSEEYSALVGDTTDITDFYKWRGDLYYNAAYAFGTFSLDSILSSNNRFLNNYKFKSQEPGGLPPPGPPAVFKEQISKIIVFH